MQYYVQFKEEGGYWRRLLSLDTCVCALEQRDYYINDSGKKEPHIPAEYRVVNDDGQIIEYRNA